MCCAHFRCDYLHPAVWKSLTSAHALLVAVCLLCLSTLSFLCLVSFVRLLAAQGPFFRSMTFCIIIVICVISGGIKLSAGCFPSKELKVNKSKGKNPFSSVMCSRCVADVNLKPAGSVAGGRNIAF